MKAKKIEIDANTIRIKRHDGKIISMKIKDIKKIRADYAYFSIYPALGVGSRLSKKALLGHFPDYNMVIRSRRTKGTTFLGMIKSASFNNIHIFLKDHHIRARHIFLSPFSLYRFTESNIKRHIVVYKSDTMFHLACFENGLPIFATSYSKTEQLDEFLSEFYEDGDATFTLLSNAPMDYTPPFAFKKFDKISKEGIILNAIS